MTLEQAERLADLIAKVETLESVMTFDVQGTLLGDAYEKAHDLISAEIRELIYSLQGGEE